MKTRKRFPWLTLWLGGVALCAFAAGESIFDLLVWKSDCLQTGEYWRVFTGHFVHVGAEHLFWDLAAFLVLGACVEGRGRLRFLGVLASTAILTDVALRLGGRFAVYCGLSGFDLGLFALAAGLVFREGKRAGDSLVKWLGGLGILAALAKVGFELLAGQAAFAGGGIEGYAVAVEAHLAGLVAALCFNGSLTTYQPVGFKGRHVTDTPT